MRAWLVSGIGVAALGGCGRAHFDVVRGDGGVDDAAIADGADAIDAMFAPDARLCFGAGLYSLCPAQPVTTSIVFGVSQTLDTDTSTLCGAYSGAPAGLCVIAAENLTVVATIEVMATGSRPLVLLATNTLAIEGAVDAASRRGGLAGPGADPNTCGMTQAPTNKDGGPGGSFGGRGGAGGGAVPAALVVASPVTELRGGCRGREGAGGMQGVGGRGGGAVYLMAGQTLAITGVVNASGAGGTGAIDTAGGGGGGSGGMIVLDAPSIVVSGVVFANGGGGGEGAGNSNAGLPGDDPSTPLMRADGGSGGAGAGDGGDGSAGNALDGLSGGLSGSSEGGGGGGGAGVIRVFPAQSLGGTISPAPS